MEFPVSNTFDVKMFGAVGDGVHDDTAAVQAAYQGLVANGGGNLYFPPGIYSAGTVLQMAPKFAIGTNVQVGISMQSVVGLSGGGALTVTAQWGAASPSNTATYYAVTVELLKSLSFL
jgi:hypothetical protein